MELSNAVVVVTGGASGIGRSLCHAFAGTGCSVAVVDLNGDGAALVAEEIGGIAIECDVSVEVDIARVVAETEAAFGPIDVFCSNAGIGFAGDPWTADDDWDRIWRVNVMAHIYAARAVLPSMRERKQGYLVQTSSAAGLLTQLGSAPYAVTKHAAVSFAEYLAVTYRRDGIRVSVLAPQAVDTAMITGEASPLFDVAAVDGLMDPDTVAQITLKAIAEERFLILPHPEVERYIQRKAGDYDRWIQGMARLQDEVGL